MDGTITISCFGGSNIFFADCIEMMLFRAKICLNNKVINRRERDKERGRGRQRERDRERERER